MELLYRSGRTFARFAGLTLALYGSWIFGVNLLQATTGSLPNPLWILPAVLVSGVAAGGGGTVFLLSIDGPTRFRTRKWRAFALSGMLLGSLLPTTLLPVVLVLSLSMVPSLFLGLPERSVTSV